MRLIIGTILALALTVASSLADPAGTYRVSGTNPGSGSTYSGTVTVKRNGDTFLLAWTIAGNRQIGVGIGKDDFLAVSYRSGDSTGIAFYRADENSGWEGIWAPLGSQTLGTEKWTEAPKDFLDWTAGRTQLTNPDASRRPGPSRTPRPASSSGLTWRHASPEHCRGPRADSINNGFP